MIYLMSLPFRTYNLICLVCEIKVKRSKCFITCIYRSPSETEEELNDFCLKFETTCSNIALENPISSFILGDFNAKCTNWWPNGINNQCGLLLDDLSTSSNYSQLINEPTNFEPHKNPSCIDLIFTTQPNLVLDSGVLPSLSETCHHQIIFTKINFQIFLPPPYRREIWHFKQAQTNCIRKSIERFDWEGALMNLDVNQQVYLFTDTLLNIFTNFIPHETITCSEKDPPWITKEIKLALRHKNRLYKKYTYGGMRIENKTIFEEYSKFCNYLICSCRESYYSNLGRKLNNSSTSPKVYWSILNRLMNKIKIPTIPPIIVNGLFETDFQRKANLFNNFFSSQCSIIENGSSLPDFSNYTENCISDIIFCDDDISRIIKNLNPNKGHGFDGISIRMIQLCGDSIIFPLSTIFKTAIKAGVFPDNWKKGNIVPVHKKLSKQLLGNYRPISLLPIFGKVFEKIVFNNLFRYFQHNKILRGGGSH